MNPEHSGQRPTKKKDCPPSMMAGSCLFSCSSSLYGRSDHLLEKDLKRHGVPAALVGHEELAIALEFTAIICYVVTVIIPMESKVKLVESKARRLLRVALRLLDFAYHSIVHCFSLLSYAK